MGLAGLVDLLVVLYPRGWRKPHHNHGATPMKLWIIPFGALIGGVALGLAGALIAGHPGAYLGLGVGAILGGTIGATWKN